MGEPEGGWHVGVAEARRAGPDAGQRIAELMRHGTMLLEYYAPRGHDPQTPHEQDELYVIDRGRGTFLRNGARTQFGPGDVLFAAAGDEHRFEDFSDDFGTWVIFWGPAGGEVPGA